MGWCAFCDFPPLHVGRNNEMIFKPLRLRSTLADLRRFRKRYRCRSLPATMEWIWLDELWVGERILVDGFRGAAFNSDSEGIYIRISSLLPFLQPDVVFIPHNEIELLDPGSEAHYPDFNFRIRDGILLSVGMSDEIRLRVRALFERTRAGQQGVVGNKGHHGAD